MSGEYEAAWKEAHDNPEAFWTEAARLIEWDRPFEAAFIPGPATDYRWFEGGRLNTCFNALDRHVRDGRADQIALIHDSPLTGSMTRFTYADLLDRVELFAGALTRLGVETGDRVVIYMPMIPETVVAMLACARIGAVHSVVFGGFAAAELAARIEDAGPKVVIAASCGLEPGRVVEYKPLLDSAIEQSEHKPSRCIILQRPQCEAALSAERDVEWHAALEGAEPAPCVAVESSHPLYILYTSGTTGKPKGVVRDNGGHAVALAWSMPNVYGCAPGETYWAASDVGWVVGHSYIVYGPLLNGSTTILYEGKPVGTPDAGAFWRVIAEHDVSTFFTAPTAIRAIRQQDPEGKLAGAYDLSKLRTLFLAGERCDPPTLEWAQSTLDVPVVDHWWQTETGWPIVANCVGIEQLPIKAGSPSRPVPGWTVAVIDQGGKEVGAGATGAIVCRLPLPPGALYTLWNDADRFTRDYLTTFAGCYQTGDAGFVDEDGYLFVMSRTDDVINTAGHRLSTGAMEEAVARHPAVAECAVVGVADSLKGQVPMGFVVLKAGASSSPDDVSREVIALVRERIGPVAAFKSCHIVARLPKTRSGKILRKTIRAIVDGEDYAVPATIEDPAVLTEIEGSVRR